MGKQKRVRDGSTGSEDRNGVKTARMWVATIAQPTLAASSLVGLPASGIPNRPAGSSHTRSAAPSPVQTRLESPNKPADLDVIKSIFKEDTVGNLRQRSWTGQEGGPDELPVQVCTSQRNAQWC